MKNKIIVLAAVVILMFTLAGCESQNDSAKCVKGVEAALEKTQTTDIDTTVNYDEDVYEDNFERLYNFSMDKVDDGVIAYAADGGKADEISIVHVADSAETNGVKKYMEARLAQRQQDFQNYKPEEVSKIENGKVIVQQQYVILVISNQADDIVRIVREALS